MINDKKTAARCDKYTKLYYCNSRYYDPQLRRFINSDGYVSTGTGFLGYNMYTYCNNNPVMHSDPSGNVVTNWDIGNLNSLEIAALEGFTTAWYKSKNNNDRKNAHNNAVHLRKKYMDQSQYVDSCGFVRDTKSNGYYSSYIFYHPTKYTINYLIEKLVIRVNTRQESLAIMIHNNTGLAPLAEQMLNNYQKYYGRAFPGRTVGGIANDILWHYNPDKLLFGKYDFFKGITSHTEVADIECSEYIGSNNGKIFEAISWG